MDKVQIEVKTRDQKKKPRALIRKSIIPGIAYDQKTTSHPIEISLNDLRSFLLNARQGQLVKLVIDGKEPQTAIFKELQMDARSNAPKHISFMILDENSKVDMPVRIQLEGEAPAVKNSLGVMIQTLNAIELRGFPKDFPSYLTIDISSLENVGDSLDMTAISIPSGLKFIRDEDKDLTVVTIRPFQKAIEEEKPVTAEGEEELAEGEVPAEEEESTEEGTVKEPEEGGETKEETPSEE